MTRTRPARVLATLTLIVGCGCGQPRGASEERPATGASTSESASETPSPEPVAGAEPAAVEGSAAEAARAWSFDGTSSGALPEGFVAAVGQWSVTTDDSAPSGASALAQLAESADDAFNVALIAGTDERDVDLSVQLRSISGRVDQGGGLVWRARDAQNYYVARYNPLEDNYRVYVVHEGRRRMLESATLRVDHSAWHTLRVVMRGERIECYLDGTSYLEASDATFSEAGQLGLWTKADAVTHFDDLSLAESEAPPL